MAPVWAGGRKLLGRERLEGRKRRREEKRNGGRPLTWMVRTNVKDERTSDLSPK